MKISAEGLALVPTESREELLPGDASVSREQIPVGEDRAALDERARYRRERPDTVRYWMRSDSNHYPKPEDAAC